MNFSKYLYIFICTLGLASCRLPIIDHAEQRKVPELQSSKRVIQDNLAIVYSWSTGPQIYNESQFKLTFYDENGVIRDIAEEELNIYIWMPTMGHGSSPVVIEKQIDRSFLIRDVYFIMGGYWVVHVNEDGGRKWQFDLTL